MAKKKAQRMWIYTPPKPTIPEKEKSQTEIVCQAFIEKMKPHWVQPPIEKWGYVSDVYGKWYRSYYYFCALYRYDFPEAIRNESEMKFTRLEYAGTDQFHLSYFRHTGQWWQVFESLSLEACLQEIESNPIFAP